ncbi:hypothetical protein AB1Y20_014088 [Prymnesium parvum]|uniref:WW domain-containing protein n=1 Tax=Prymnesium parvum TaxID=97485 RepID=A0AB34IHF2_PRYPA
MRAWVRRAPYHGSLARHLSEQSHPTAREGMSATVDCAKSLVGRVIGRGGETINDLQNKSGTRIQIDQQVPEGQPCKITITGPPPNVQSAVAMVNEVMKNGPPRGGIRPPTVAPAGPGGYAPPGYGAPPQFGYPPQGYGGYPPPGQFGGYTPQGYGNYPSPAQGYGGYPPPYGAPTYPPAGFVPPPGPQGYGGPPPQQQQPPQGFMHSPPGQLPPGGASPWQEHKTHDGNSYWYNPQTDTSQWEKPAGV